MKLKFFEFISVALCVVMLAVTSFLPATASVKPASIKLQNTISQYEVENNSEEIALETLKKTLKENNVKFNNIDVAKQNESTEEVLVW